MPSTPEAEAGAAKAPLKRTLDQVLGDQVSGTALGPADVRDTPSVLTRREPEDHWIGQMLANVYSVERRIGEGGMGTVYAARHIHLGKEFAIKVLNPEVAKRDNAVERLKQEAKAASSIDHESIVDVVNFDRTPEGAVFIVMELLRGESLAERVGRGPIKAHIAADFGMQICAALEAAHGHGIVHRDLKPENIFLVPRGEGEVIKILDFGISKIKSAEAEQVRMTRTGQLVGTPLYMSPEQARGETEIDRRVDIYSAGVILYEMISGAPPFEGRNYFELLWKHGNEIPPPLREKNPQVYVPEALERAILKALAKNPKERFGSMSELGEAIRRSLTGQKGEQGAEPAEGAHAAAGGEAPQEEELGLRPTLPAPEAALGAAIAIEAPDLRGGARTEGGTPIVLPTSRLPLYLGLGAALIALLLGAFALATPSGSPDERSLATEPVGASERGGSERGGSEQGSVGTSGEEALEEGADPPELTSVRFLSEPPGAEVRMGELLLGRTPCAYSMLLTDEPVQIRFQLAQHLDEEISVSASSGEEIRVRMRRRRGPRSGSREGAEELPFPGKQRL